MKLGCDVIKEKPLTVKVGKALSFLDVVKSTNRSVKFNNRYPLITLK